MHTFKLVFLYFFCAYSFASRFLSEVINFLIFLHLLWLCTSLSLSLCWWSNSDKMKTAKYERKLLQSTQLTLALFFTLLFISQRDYSTFTCYAILSAFLLIFLSENIFPSCNCPPFLSPFIMHILFSRATRCWKWKCEIYWSFSVKRERLRASGKFIIKKNLEMHLKVFFSMKIPSSELLLLLHHTAC